MKFDVIVGNPPYQDSEAKSSKKMWPVFVKQAMSMLVKDGHVGFITPASWLSGKNGVLDFFKEKQCTFVCFNGTKWFPKVGTTISYYVIKNTDHVGPTLTSDKFELDFAAYSFLPNNPNPHSLSILLKTLNMPSFSVKISSEHHSQRIDIVKEESTNEFCFPNKHTATQLRWTKTPHSCTNIRKVLFPISSAMKAEYDAGGEFGATQHYAWLEVTNEIEGVNFSNYLNSAFVRWLRLETSTSASWDKTILRQLPAVDLSRNWTDAELYAHFGLTQEEIDYVESTVK